MDGVIPPVLLSPWSEYRSHQPPFQRVATVPEKQPVHPPSLKILVQHTLPEDACIVGGSRPSCHQVDDTITGVTSNLYIDGMITFTVHVQILMIRWSLDLDVSPINAAQDSRDAGVLAEPLLHQR